MKTYYGIEENYSSKPFGLKMDYSLAEVGDTLALMRPEPTPKGFLDRFSYKRVGGLVLEDVVPNNMGWKIYSERIATIFSKCANSHDVELLPLPEKTVRLNPKLKEYRVLGTKREIPCVDLDKSKVRWGTLPSGGKHIEALHKCILKASAIPENVDVFRLAEYPVFPVISFRLATSIAELLPTGFIIQSIQAV